MATPTNENQLMLELINQARANPQAEADRLLSGDLNEGLAPGTISTAAKQPLAWNELLADAAVGHTQAMFDDDFFAHTNPITSSTLGTRVTAVGYPWRTLAENLAATVNSAPQDLATETSAHHDNLVIDSGVPGRGHRVAIMNGEFREVGFGTQLGTNFQGPFSRTWEYAALTTQVYADQFNSSPFLTGVVFTDAIVSDDFYTIGEGLGNVTVDVFNDSDGSLAGSTTTYSSGGYQIPLAAGTYDVSVTADFDQDGTSETLMAEDVVIGTQNVKVDFECFLTGTRLLTDKGDRAVEDLKIGDLVQTSDGTLEPVKWIGRQTCDPKQVRYPLRSYPILIKAGALGSRLPYRDLRVSPDHALVVEGVLINAGALVNRTSIIQTTPTETFTYYHVELDKHALLVAEGTAAESYLPQKEDRLAYDNGAEYEALYPHDSKIILWPLDYPRVSSYPTVPRFVRRKLGAIATQLGLVASVS